MSRMSQSIQDILEMIDNGYTDTEISARLSVSIELVREWRRSSDDMVDTGYETDDWK